MKFKKPWLALLILGLILVVYFFRSQEVQPVVEPLVRNTENLRLTKHARCRMKCRHIDITEVREIVEKGRVNEAKSDPEGKPDPKYAIEGRTHDGQEVRIVVATTSKGLLVITVIDLKEEWDCACP